MSLLLVATLLLSGIVAAAEPPTTIGAGPAERSQEESGPALTSFESARLLETLLEIRGRSEPPSTVRTILAGIDADEAAMTLAAATARSWPGAPAAAVELRDARRIWVTTVARLDRQRGELGTYASQLERDLSTLDEARDRWTIGRAALPSDAQQSLVAQADRTLDAIKATRDDVSARNHNVMQATVRIDLLLGTASAVLEDLDQALRDILFSRDSAPLWSLAGRNESDGDVWQLAGAAAQQWVQDLMTYAVDAPWRIAAQVTLGWLAAWAFVRSRRRSDEHRAAGVPGSWRALVQRPASSAVVLSLGAGTLLHARAPTAFFDVVFVLALFPLARVLRMLVPQVSLRPMYLLFGVYLLNRSVALVVGAGLSYRLGLIAAQVLALATVGWVARYGTRTASSEAARRWVLPVALAVFGAALIANVVGFVALASVVVDGAIASMFTATVLWTCVVLLDGCVRFAARLPAAQQLGVIRNHGNYVEDRLGLLLRVAGVLGWTVSMLLLLSLAQPLSEWVGQILGAELSVGTIDVALGDLLAFSVSMWLAVAVSRLIRFVLEEDVLPRMRLPKGVPETASTLTHYAVLATGMFVALAASGVHLDQFAFAAGALGIGIGFGLQGIVNNLVSGLILLFERPIQVGDIIELASLTGTVKHIGMRASRVRTLDGAEVIVPNSSLITDPVINWTHSDRVRRFELVVGVAYGSRPEQVICLLQDVARGTPGVMPQPEPVTLLDGFGASSIDFIVRAWAAYDDHLAVRSAVHVRIEEALREARIEIPYPQRDLHLRSVEGRTSITVIDSDAS